MFPLLKFAPEAPIEKSLAPTSALFFAKATGWIFSGKFSSLNKAKSRPGSRITTLDLIALVLLLRYDDGSDTKESPRDSGK